MIEVKLEDITLNKSDAIVNAANCSLLGGGGVDGCIHSAAGFELYEECKELGGCDVGEAKITKGYKLPAKYVIHTVGPVYSKVRKEECEKLLASCYQQSLELAKENDIHSIAFPAISTGAYGFPAVPAARIAVSSVKKWLSDNPDYKLDVTFSCYDGYTEGIYKRLV